MKAASVLMILGAGLFPAGCRREANETATMPVQPVAVSPTSASAVVRRAPRTENIVVVTEDQPGLRDRAKFHPLDAQHVAQTKFPFGVVERGVLEIRGGDLVYNFRIRDDSTHLVHEVLVDAVAGKLVTSIPVRSARSPR